MENRFQIVDDWMAGFAAGAFNASARKGVQAPDMGAAVEVDREFKHFAHLDLSGM